jgi:prephenate dehydrogenase
MFKRIAIFGLGLLGGSICKGLKEIDPGIHVTAYGRDGLKLKPSMQGGFVDEVRGYDALALSGMDLGVVAMPVGASIGVIRRLLEHHEMGEDAIIIDVGSVKENIVTSVLDCKRAGQFVGCHPMAGSEKSGFEFSLGSLFEGASVIITPHQKNRDADIARVRELWESLGSRVVVISPEEHDMFVTYTSHLPHMVAGAMVSVLGGFRRLHGEVDIKSFVGRGFLDVTRITSGSPDMWRDIVLCNKKNILDALSLMVEELVKLREAVNSARANGRHMHDYFTNVKKTRDTLE